MTGSVSLSVCIRDPGLLPEGYPPPAWGGGGGDLPPFSSAGFRRLTNIGNPTVPGLYAGWSRGNRGDAATQMGIILVIVWGGRGYPPRHFIFRRGTSPPPCMGGGGGYPPSDTCRKKRFFGFSDGRCPEESSRKQGGWGYPPPVFFGAPLHQQFDLVLESAGFVFQDTRKYVSEARLKDQNQQQEQE